MAELGVMGLCPHTQGLSPATGDHPASAQSPLQPVLPLGQLPTLFTLHLHPSHRASSTEPCSHCWEGMVLSSPIGFCGHKGRTGASKVPLLIHIELPPHTLPGEPHAQLSPTSSSSSSSSQHWPGRGLTQPLSFSQGLSNCHQGQDLASALTQQQASDLGAPQVLNPTPTEASLGPGLNPWALEVETTASSQL